MFMVRSGEAIEFKGRMNCPDHSLPVVFQPIKISQAFETLQGDAFITNILRFGCPSYEILMQVLSR